jgi:hypothetical protein
MKLKGIILLEVFSSTLVILVRYVGFDTFDKRSSPARLFIYVFVALFAIGAAEWVLNTIGPSPHTGVPIFEAR